MANPLVELLNLSLRLDKTLSDVLDIINDSIALISSSKTSENLLDLHVLISLNKIQIRYKHSVYLPLANLYLIILQIYKIPQITVLIHLCENVLQLCAIIKGTKISEDLRMHLKQNLLLLQNKEKSTHDIKIIGDFLHLFKTKDFEPALQIALLNIRDNNLQGINELIEVFSSFDNIFSQYEFFKIACEKIVTEISKTNNPQIISNLLSILDNIVYQNTFTISIHEGIENYLIVNHKIPLIIEQCVQALDAIVPYEVEITQKCIIILQRL